MVLAVKSNNVRTIFKCTKQGYDILAFTITFVCINEVFDDPDGFLWLGTGSIEPALVPAWRKIYWFTYMKKHISQN